MFCVQGLGQSDDREHLIRCVSATALYIAVEACLAEISQHRSFVLVDAEGDEALLGLRCLWCCCQLIVK
jgi:hypothetical protein